MTGIKMGNQLSRQQAARRWSVLREELTFPEPSWELYDGWEIYHIDIELQTLPPHVRDKILDFCVDEYTQEIISCEGGECTHKTHLCSKSQPCSQKQDSSDNIRLQDDVNSTEEKCLQDNGDVCQNICVEGSESPSGLNNRGDHKNELDELLLQWNLCLRESSGSESYSKTDSVQSRSHDVSSSRVDPDTVENRKEVSASNSVLVNAELKSTVQKRESSSFCKMHEESSSSKLSSCHFKSVHRRCLSEMESIDFTTLCPIKDPGCCSKDNNQCSKSLPQPVPTSKPNGAMNSLQSKLLACTGNFDDISPFTSSSLPTRRQSTPAVRTRKQSSLPNSPACRKKRKFSLKDEPGWIPNPLDSDSDQEQSEDSGVFSDYAASPKQAPNLCAELLAHKAVVRLKERRRHNSEPSGTTSTNSSLSENHSDSENNKSSILGTRRHSTSDSKWSLVKSPWRKNKSKLLDDSKLSVPTEVEEGDLEKELEWLVSDPDCETSENKDSPEEDVPVNDDSVSPTNSSNTDSSVASISPLYRQPAGALQQELELDWLCEPEWNNLELETFWNVLRPHLEFLLQQSETEHLPDPRVVVACMDSADQKMLDSCLLHVQRHIWKGNYRQAVADFRAVKRHFRCCANSRLIQRGIQQDDVESLRLVFLRKRPSRYRLWI